MSPEPDATEKSARLPSWLWLWFPPLLLVVILPVRLVAPAFYSHWIDGELGLIELATPLLSLIAVYFGVAALQAAPGTLDSRVRLWVLLTTLGSFYLTGEEVSWGQHLFGWRTPASIEAINDQEETNLHNVSSWFDQKPRMLLEIWVLVGGIIVPVRAILSRAIGTHRASRQFWFWPTIECLPTATLAILVRLPERLKSLFGIESLPLEIRFSEPQEYYFALFLLIYLASINRRLRR